MLYLVYSSMFFELSLDKELRSIADFKIKESYTNVLVIESDTDFVKEFEKRKMVFAYSIFALDGVMKIDEKEYMKSLSKAMKKLKLDKKKRTMIECYDVNSRTDYSAKDIEVKLGQEMESEGFAIDIDKPQVLAYLLLLNMRCYYGSSDYSKLHKKFLDPMRHYKKTGRIVSRAEAKLLQALDEFQVKGKGIAIDLGAAPGGWSSILAKRGFKVLAIDNADLEYERIGSEKLSFTMLSNVKKKTEVGRYLARNDIVHVKEKAEIANRLIDVKDADLILNDMNVEPDRSAKMVMEYLPFLAKEARLIMTVKCVTRKVEDYIKQAEDALEGTFKVIAVREMPSNRQEVTLFAERI